MSAFGRRSGTNGNGRPSFGTAQPMKGPAPAQARPADAGGAQFPPIEPEALDIDGTVTTSLPQGHVDAMARLADRQAQSGEQGNSRSEGFEASIHRIKEQVLPRLLERVDPGSGGNAQQGRARRGIPSDHRRGARRAEDQPQPPRAVRAGEGAGRRAARPRPARGAAQRPGCQRHHGERPAADLYRKEGASSSSPRSSSATRSICSRSPSASSTRSAAASIRPRRSPTPACRTAAASTSSSRRSPCAAPPSRSANSPRSRSPST